MKYVIHGKDGATKSTIELTKSEALRISTSKSMNLAYYKIVDSKFSARAAKKIKDELRFFISTNFPVRWEKVA